MKSSLLNFTPYELLQQAYVVCLHLVHVLYRAADTASQQAASPSHRRQTPLDQTTATADVVVVSQHGHSAATHDALQDNSERQMSNHKTYR